MLGRCSGSSGRQFLGFNNYEGNNSSLCSIVLRSANKVRHMLPKGRKNSMNSLSKQSLKKLKS